MVNYCPHCGRRVTSNEDTACVACGQPLRIAASSSTWATLLRFLGIRSRSSVVRRSIQRVHLDQTTKYVWNDPVTGRECTATSLEDVPPEVRRRMANLANTAAAGDLDSVTGNSFVLRDASGQERRYGSLDEMPPEVREMFERYGRKHGGLP